MPRERWQEDAGDAEGDVLDPELRGGRSQAVTASQAGQVRRRCELPSVAVPRQRYVRVLQMPNFIRQTTCVVTSLPSWTLSPSTSLFSAV